MRRIILGLIAMFSTVLFAVTAAPAVAGNTVDTRSGDAFAAGEALPAHQIRRLRTFEIRDTGRFRVAGRAITYRRKDVILKKASRKAGPYRYVDQDRTDADGRFTITFGGTIGTHFKIFLKKTAHNRATSFYLGRIVAG